MVNKDEYILYCTVLYCIVRAAATAVKIQCGHTDDKYAQDNTTISFRSQIVVYKSQEIPTDERNLELAWIAT